MHKKLITALIASAAVGVGAVAATAAHASNEIIVKFDALGWEANPVVDIDYVSRGLPGEDWETPRKTCTLPEGITTTAGAGPLELCSFDNDFKIWKLSIRESSYTAPDGTTRYIYPHRGYLYPGAARPPRIVDWDNTNSVKTKLTKVDPSVYEFKFYLRDEVPVAPKTALMVLSSTPCTITGTSGDDRAIGGSGDDTLLGGIGDDLLRGASGEDILRGGSGDDAMMAGRQEAKVVQDSGDWVTTDSNVNIIEVHTGDAPAWTQPLGKIQKIETLPEELVGAAKQFAPIASPTGSYACQLEAFSMECLMEGIDDIPVAPDAEPDASLNETVDCTWTRSPTGALFCKPVPTSADGVGRGSTTLS